MGRSDPYDDLTGRCNGLCGGPWPDGGTDSIALQENALMSSVKRFLGRPAIQNDYCRTNQLIRRLVVVLCDDLIRWSMTVPQQMTVSLSALTPAS